MARPGLSISVPISRWWNKEWPFKIVHTVTIFPRYWYSPVSLCLCLWPVCVFWGYGVWLQAVANGSAEQAGFIETQSKEWIITLVFVCSICVDLSLYSLMALKTSLGGGLLSESMNVMDWPSLANAHWQQFLGCDCLVSNINICLHWIHNLYWLSKNTQVLCQRALPVQRCWVFFRFATTAGSWLGVPSQLDSHYGNGNKRRLCQ